MREREPSTMFSEILAIILHVGQSGETPPSGSESVWLTDVLMTDDDDDDVVVVSDTS